MYLLTKITNIQLYFVERFYSFNTFVYWTIFTKQILRRKNINM